MKGNKIMMTRKSARNIFISFVSVAAVACGSSNSGTTEESTDTSTTEIASSDTELVRVQINISDKNSSLSLTNGASLGLTAAAENFSLDIDSCATGYTNTGITSASGPIDVYKGDIGCLAKLKSLTLGGNAYTPSVDFTTWQAGDTAVFSFGGEDLALTITSTLANPISGTEAIDITFSEIDEGTVVNVAANALGDSHNITVAGEESPAFQVTSVTLDSVTAQGAGNFTFEFTCDSAVAGTGATATCETHTIIDVDYVLLEDTFGGSLTYAQAQTEIAAGADVLSGDVTAAGFNASATGPDQMHNNPNMIMLIGVTTVDGTSFRYINIDLTTL